MSVATRRASSPARQIRHRQIAIRLPALDPWTASYAGAGLLIGGLLGSRHGFELDDPATWEWFSPEFGTLALTVCLIAGLGLFGLVLSIAQSTRTFGIGLLTSAVFIVVGVPLGAAVSPRWHPVERLVGHVRVELTAPVAQVLEASAICTTLANDVRVGSIEASPLGRVGVDELHLRLDWDATATAGSAGARLALRVNANPGYEGELRVIESGHDRLTGRGTFSGAESGAGWIGGASSAAAGEVSWDCTGGAVQTLPPWASPTPELSPLRGWFHLRGIVTVEQDVPGATPPLEGRASGQCSRAFELRTSAIETVVPWVGGQRARLRLVPELARATLTVDLGDGSAPETATAPASVLYLDEAQTDRVLSAVFGLRDGRLGLTVEWWCPR